MDDGFAVATPVEIVGGQETGLARRVSHEDTALLGALHKALVVAADAIAHRDKAKLVFVKHVAVFRSDLQELVGEAVVVLLLL